MKKFFLTSAILSLSMLFTQPLTAQIKVLSNGNVEISNKTSFKLSGNLLEIKMNTPSWSTNNANVNGIIGGGGDIDFNNGEIVIQGAKHKLNLGSASTELKEAHAKTFFSSTNLSIHSSSDLRYKTNIKELTPSADKIMRLRPVTFDYREEKDGPCTTDPERMNRVGFIAQELVEVMPQAVHYIENIDLYTVEYGVLIPFLVKTAQEQQEQIENQHHLIQDLQLQIGELQAIVANENATPDAVFNSVSPKDTPAETVTAETNRLWSNVPNPFKQETRIRYALTDDVRDAQLCIYDLSGKQIACHRLNDRGESEFTLRAASLMPGIYLYSLIADGNVVDTHRMVVTE